MTRPVHEEFTVDCYDVADDRRRREISKVLEGYGRRVQESVFECWLAPAQRQALKARLDRLMTAAEDRVAFYALSARDAADIIAIGSGTPLTENPDAFLA